MLTACVKTVPILSDFFNTFLTFMFHFLYSDEATQRWYGAIYGRITWSSSSVRYAHLVSILTFIFIWLLGDFPIGMTSTSISWSNFYKIISVISYTEFWYSVSIVHVLKFVWALPLKTKIVNASPKRHVRHSPICQVFLRTTTILPQKNEIFMCQ